MSGIGHNRGPSMDGGASWRRHCWRKARADLLPTLPIEVVRLRVKRAKEIGLDYHTYASFRAASGHDIVALLFSTNASGYYAEFDHSVLVQKSHPGPLKKFLISTRSG